VIDAALIQSMLHCPQILPHPGHGPSALVLACVALPRNPALQRCGQRSAHCPPFGVRRCIVAGNAHPTGGGGRAVYLMSSIATRIMIATKQATKAVRITHAAIRVFVPWGACHSPCGGRSMRSSSESFMGRGGSPESRVQSPESAELQVRRLRRYESGLRSEDSGLWTLDFLSCPEIGCHLFSFFFRSR
jgi:hypothetical protein